MQFMGIATAGKDIVFATYMKSMLAPDQETIWRTNINFGLLAESSGSKGSGHDHDHDHFSISNTSTDTECGSINTARNTFIDVTADVEMVNGDEWRID
eukprot:Pgem_evm1s13733